jgi:hypothetical protein
VADQAQTDAGKRSFARDTGIPVVDRQHRQLLQQMERLATAASAGLMLKEHLAGADRRLADYLREH